MVEHVEVVKWLGLEFLAIFGGKYGLWTGEGKGSEESERESLNESYRADDRSTKVTKVLSDIRRRTECTSASPSSSLASPPCFSF